MRTTFLIFSLICYSSLVFSQKSDSHTEVIDYEGYFGEYITLDIPNLGPGPFIALALEWEEDADIKSFYVKAEKDSTTKPLHFIIEQDHHLDGDNRFFTELLYIPMDYQQVSIRSRNYTEASVKVHFYNPGISDKPNTNTATKSGGNCNCLQPVIQYRQDWCPSGNCPPHPNPTNITVSHLIVHHSAGGNTSSDWAAVVRSIWNLHVNINGWSDIGYNWLVDPNGVIYEGRGDNVLGAHFCGTNGASAGICMIGNYNTVVPQTNQVQSLTQLLAWKSCSSNINPTDTSLHIASGLTIPNITGHRDGCATDCPGHLLYPMLDNIRQDVDLFINDSCNTFIPMPAPTNLDANVFAYNEVEIFWQDNSTDEDSFLIERSVSFANNYTYLASVAADDTTYVDTTTTGSTGYFYRVRAVNTSDTSGYSNEKFVATFPTSTADLSKHQYFRVYPNPAKNYFNVFISDQLEGAYTIQIIELATGRIVHTVKATGNLQIQTETLSSGVYDVILSNENQQWHQMLLIR